MMDIIMGCNQQYLGNIPILAIPLVAETGSRGKYSAVGRYGIRNGTDEAFINLYEITII